LSVSDAFRKPKGESGLSKRVHADEIRKELLAAAVERRTLTYGELMRKFYLGRGDAGAGVVAAISEVDKSEYAKGSPGFAALVVRKDTGYPGGGFFCWEDIPSELRRSPERCQDPKLSEAEKRYIRSQQEKIWSYYASEDSPSRLA